MYDFPVEVQRWIIGQKIIEDTEALIDLRVNSSTPVYIYLISAEKAGITRQGVEVGRQALLTQQQQRKLLLFTILRGSVVLIGYDNDDVELHGTDDHGIENRQNQ